MNNIYNAIQNLYNMDKTTWQEVLAELYNLVANIDNKFDLFELKFGSLLGEQVTRELKKMYDDGSLASLINDKLLKDINTKVDTFKTEVSEQLDTNMSLLNDINVNVKIFGAIGDGITDDTLAINNAIKFAYLNSKKVYFPSGKYLVSTIKLQRVTKIVGENLVIDPYMTFNDDIKRVEIICNSEILFTKDSERTITLQLKGIQFKTNNSNCSAFSNFNLYASTIEYNSFVGFKYIFDTLISNVTRIQFNYFVGIKSSFVTKNSYPEDINIVDSWICHNYINGDKSTNTLAFDVKGINTSSINNNYIDFFRKCFVFDGGCYSVDINSNIFDYIYACFSGLVISSLRITNNSFIHCSKAYVNYFINPSTEMVNNDWIVLTCGYAGANSILISNNYIQDCNKFIYFNECYNMYSIKIIGNTYSGITANNKVYFNCTRGGLSYDHTNIYIDDLMYKEYETLPNASLTNGNIVSFNKQIIVYNDKPLININGVWKDFSGNTVSS